MTFHVLNRGNDQRTIFEDEADYAAFLRLSGRAQDASPMRVYAEPTRATAKETLSIRPGAKGGSDG